MNGGDLDLLAAGLLAARGVTTDDPLTFAAALFEAQFMFRVSAFLRPKQ